MRHAIKTTPHRRFGRFTPQISETEYLQINDAIDALAGVEIPDGVSTEGQAVIGQLRTNLASTITHARARLNREFVMYARKNPYARFSDEEILRQIQALSSVSIHADRYDGKDFDNRAAKKRELKAEAVKRGLA